MLAPWDSPLVRQLLAADDVQLLNIRHADAYVALYPYLSEVVPPSGGGDMAKSRPPNNVVLLAPKASLVRAQQALVLLILVFGVLYPLLRLAPAIHGWAMRYRVYGLYGELKFLEQELSSQAVRDDKADLVARLDGLDERASRFRVPTAFGPLLYTLRLHITLVRQRLESRAAPS